MFRARFQADAPVEVTIRDQIGNLEIPSAEQMLHIGMSIANLRLLGRSIAETLNEYDIGQRNIVSIRRVPKA